MEQITIETARGITVGVRVYQQGGSSGDAPLLYLHGAMGLLAEEPALEALSRRRTVYAPIWPGYGDALGEDLVEDMLDFALHGWDVAVALQHGGYLDASGPVHVAGHCMGGMIAAEMACLAPAQVASLTLIDPFGVWLDTHPIPDIFATMPFDFPAMLFHDPGVGTRALIGGTDWNDPKAIEKFLISNARRLGTAGKILFPVPNRRLSKRLYRLTTPTLLVWGDDDRLIASEPYARKWNEIIPHATTVMIPSAGHLPTIEAAAATIDAIEAFLTRSSIAVG